MAVQKGCNAIVQVENPASPGTFVLIDESTSWSLNTSMESTSYKKLGNCSSITLGTTESWSFSLDGKYDPVNAGQVLIKHGTQKFRVFPTDDHDDATGAFFEGSAVVTSIDRAGSADDDLMTFSVSGEGSGNLTMTGCW